MTAVPALAAEAPAPAGDCFAWADQGQRAQVALLKRFVELLAADPGLGQSLRLSPGQGRQIMAQRGLALDPDEVSPFWQDGFNPWPKPEQAGGAPLLVLWDRWQRSLASHRDMLRAIDGLPPGFAAWRRRQMGRTRLELGGFAQNLTYPALAFELSKGCSLGCWFCALDAPRLSAVFRRDAQGARPWRETLGVCAELLGPSALGGGVCYWATEPADNPDYPALLADLADIAGRPGPTTTAAATRDPAWTRALMAMYAGRPGLRFSVLSLELLAKIHALFSPLELLFIDCLAQNDGSAIPKSHSGRARRQARWLASRQAAEAGLASATTSPEHETTACLAGYKINMVDQTAELLSPCAVSDRWPMGYRTHARAVFGSGQELGQFIGQTMERCMPQSPPAGRPLRFGHGLSWRETNGRLEAHSAVASMALPAGQALGQIARLLDQGTLDAQGLIDQAQRQGLGLFEAMAALDLLFERGLLDDDPPDGAA